MMHSIGTLYIVATPIGNLEDITLRALRILSEVDTVFCEDTRHTKRLFTAHSITTRMQSFHAHSDLPKIKTIIRMLEEGKDIALVSDAGTPLVSDPGSPLLVQVRATLGVGAHIVPVPGASALTAALSVIPVPGGKFTFLGFLPHKKGRQTLIKQMQTTGDSYVMYESTHRILKLLSELDSAYPRAHVWIARELTKEFEEIKEGSPGELLTLLTNIPEKQKGEFVVVVTA